MILSYCGPSVAPRQPLGQDRLDAGDLILERADLRVENSGHGDSGAVNPPTIHMIVVLSKLRSAA